MSDIVVQLPSAPSQKRAAANVRKKFASGTYSDHMALLRAFQVSCAAAEMHATVKV